MLAKEDIKELDVKGDGSVGQYTYHGTQLTSCRAAVISITL